MKVSRETKDSISGVMKELKSEVGSHLLEGLLLDWLNKEIMGRLQVQEPAKPAPTPEPPPSNEPPPWDRPANGNDSKREGKTTIGILACLGMLLLSVFLYAQTGRVGPLPTPDATNTTLRLDRSSAQCTQSLGGNNRERVRRGGCYFAANQGTGVAPGTALGTTAQLVVYNPTNSGVLAVIHKVWDPYFSGTLGTGTLYHCVNQTVTQTAPSGGTLLVNQPALGGNNNSSVCVVRTGATTVQPIIVAPFAYLPPELATTVTAEQQTVEMLDDMIQLLPGTTYQLQAVAAAGTSPLLSPAVFWEEVPLLNGQP